MRAGDLSSPFPVAGAVVRRAHVSAMQRIWPRPVSSASGRQRQKRRGMIGSASRAPQVAAGISAPEPFGRGQGRDDPSPPSVHFNSEVPSRSAARPLPGARLWNSAIRFLNNAHSTTEREPL